jgi:predicted small lipoprotein YifL
MKKPVAIILVVVVLLAAGMAGCGIRASRIVA